MDRERAACERELQHIVDIKETGKDPETEKGRVLYREALVEWEKQHKSFEGKVDKRDKRINQATSEIYQLVGLYSVFVGVVYTAVVQSSNLACQHIWSPIILCVLAYFVIFDVTVKKIRVINKDLLTRNRDEKFRKRAYKNLRDLKSEGHTGFSFLDLEKSTVPESTPEVAAKKSWVPVISFITILTLALIGSFAHIVCFPRRVRASNQ